MYRASGDSLRPGGPDSSYRTLARQRYYWNLYLSGRGNLAARPGTSNHGWGLAVDLASPAMRRELDHIGARYGWAKRWSDAPGEWWHIRWVPGHFKPKPPDPLTKRERRLVNELKRLRRQVHGDWKGHPTELARANSIKRWIVNQRVRIKTAAEQTGWKTANRQTRYDRLGAMLNN